MSATKQTIETAEQLQGFVREAITDIASKNPEVLISALFAQGNRAALQEAFKGMGVTVADGAADARVVAQALRDARDEGRVLRGFGVRHRDGLTSRRVYDPALGRQRNTYLHDPEIRKLGDAWWRSFIAKDLRDPDTGLYSREIVAKMNEATRAPASPLVSTPGTGGALLVPHLVSAEIFELLTEKFTLQNMVEVFTSAAPLRVPREIALVSLSWGGQSVDISEKDMAALLGGVELSPRELKALTYINPTLAAAAAVGPINWVTDKFSSALAREYQKVIVAGDGIGKPKGISALGTAAPTPVIDRAATATWDNTSQASRRASFDSLYYNVPPGYRDLGGFVWIGNNRLVRKLKSLNDQDVRDFEMGTDGQPDRYMNKPIVEVADTVLTVTANQTTALGAVMSQYAWLESTEPLTLDQTTEGGKAWESGSIGVRVISKVDGTPAQPNAFAKMDAVDV